MSQRPSVVRSVHFHKLVGQGDPLGEPLAAIITKLNEDGTVGLAVFDEMEIVMMKSVSMGGPEGTTPTGGCWNWPPYVPSALPAIAKLPGT
jgi:hypothetical protein